MPLFPFLHVFASSAPVLNPILALKIMTRLSRLCIVTIHHQGPPGAAGGPAEGAATTKTIGKIIYFYRIPSKFSIEFSVFDLSVHFTLRP